MPNIDEEVYKLVQQLDKTQWEPREIKIPDSPIITKADLRKKRVNKNGGHSKTSGTTGEPIFIQKWPLQQIWHTATNIRELQWKKWDVADKKIVYISEKVTRENKGIWQLNPILYPIPGIAYAHPPNGRLQEWINTIKPDYIHSYPSILRLLNLEGIQAKSTGEIGGTSYSCEELGTVAIECPDNPEVYHVMENIIIEIDEEGFIIATDTTHPYLKRYKLGDKGEFGTCTCGRTLQTLKKGVLGRQRNYVSYPDGTKGWASTMYIQDVAKDVVRVQRIQESIDTIRLKVQGYIPDNLIENVKRLVKTNLMYPFNVEIEFVENFPDGKFEEFISKVI